MKKLKLKKVIISNLDEASARGMYGGRDTWLGQCTQSCTNGSPCNCSGVPICNTNACASGPYQPACTFAEQGCSIQPCLSVNNMCFSQTDCTMGHCTDTSHTCKSSYTDATC